MAGPQSSDKSIDRVLVAAGLCSRTQARAAVAAGRVEVNGAIVREPDTWIDVGCAVVRVDGELLRSRPRAVWMLHKPTGVVTARVDHRARPTVCDLLPPDLDWLAPIGRLDLETTGLLLFTNDGELARGILAPASKLPKTYEVRCSGQLQDEQLERMRLGLDIGDGAGPTLPAQVELVERGAYECSIRIAIHEGRNRQVRKMVRAIGSGVLALHRSFVGPLGLGDLAVGAARALTAVEEPLLRAAVAGAMARAAGP
jgi:pseudouridine synthase